MPSYCAKICTFHQCFSFSPVVQPCFISQLLVHRAIYRGLGALFSSFEKQSCHAVQYAPSPAKVSGVEISIEFCADSPWVQGVRCHTRPWNSSQSQGFRVRLPHSVLIDCHSPSPLALPYLQAFWPVRCWTGRSLVCFGNKLWRDRRNFQDLYCRNLCFHLQNRQELCTKIVDFISTISQPVSIAAELKEISVMYGSYSDSKYRFAVKNRVRFRIKF